jgi:hypothetical protein
MSPFLYYLALLLLSSRGLAVTIRAYWSKDCADGSVGRWSGTNGFCDRIADNTCCMFSPTAGTMPPGQWSGNTRSVEWTGFGECQLLIWHQPNSHNGFPPGTRQHNCGGQIRDTYSSASRAHGQRLCMKSSYDVAPHGQVHDGALW